MKLSIVATTRLEKATSKLVASAKAKAKRAYINRVEAHARKLGIVTGDLTSFCRVSTTE